jgi:predicted nuclease of restriction endonuclease-like RecB superfamily
VRFSLQDIKKTISRRGGELCLALHFLDPGELSTEIEQLIAYHERQLGQPQRQFSLDDARASIGDYRMAHCLIAALSNWYSWQQPGWAAVVQKCVGRNEEEQGGSEQGGNEQNGNVRGEQGEDKSYPYVLEGALASPVQLRLALYDYVNERYGGFLDTSTRSIALQQFAEMYHLPVSGLEYLLVLDSEEEALLVRSTPEPPSARKVGILYNQWAFEAALFNASNVHFVIDCAAFGNASAGMGTPFTVSTPTVSTGIGAVIKRLCYLARKLGVYYDLTYEDKTSVRDGREMLLVSQQVTPPYLHLTLYGPQEVTGAPQQYGLRLARLCRMLLGYATLKSEAGPQKGKKIGLASAVVEAEATVHFLQRSYKFVMDASILQLIDSTLPETSTLFDSSIEESFAEAFTALANSQGVDGWRLEREPEPLLLEQSIFIPDFALTRGQRRIYVEILGFWTPSYRERKIAKLHQLSGRNDLLLAIPDEAKDAFASIAPYFPIVIYDGQLSVTDILQTLRGHYDDFSERLAAIDVAAVRELVMKKGLVPESASSEMLRCYRRSELQRAAERVVNDEIIFIPGLGLYQVAEMEQLKRSFLTWMGTVHSLPLREVLGEMRLRWSMLAACEDATLEALLGLWSEIQIQRSSIFDATVELPTAVGAQFIAPETVPAVAEKEIKKVVREKRPSLKKRSSNETIQGDLWT